MKRLFEKVRDPWKWGYEEIPRWKFLIYDHIERRFDVYWVILLIGWAVFFIYWLITK